jgi:hypothetical protein
LTDGIHTTRRVEKKDGKMNQKNIELAKKAHKIGIKESIILINEAIVRLQKKLEDEEEEGKLMENISDADYLLKYPDKVEKINKQFGEN